jgi:Uma2 family endonuclease
MRSSAADDRRISIEEYADLADDGWWTELVRGRVVREPQPSYDHGRVQATIIGALTRHVREHAPDLVCVGNVGVITDELGATVRGPDAAVVHRSRLDLGRAGFIRGAPDLPIEVVSPSNRAGEIQTKVKEYFAAGARLVWVVYPETRTVAVHESPGTARFLGEHDVLDGGEVLPELSLLVGEIFSD